MLMGEESEQSSQPSKGSKPRGKEPHNDQASSSPEVGTKLSRSHLLGRQSGVSSWMGKRDFTQDKKQMQQTRSAE
jgi:hypothetical protein